jgi:hypothetical protein
MTTDTLRSQVIGSCTCGTSDGIAYSALVWTGAELVTGLCMNLNCHFPCAPAIVVSSLDRAGSNSTPPLLLTHSVFIVVAIEPSFAGVCYHGFGLKTRSRASLLNRFAKVLLCVCALATRNSLSHPGITANAVGNACQNTVIIFINASCNVFKVLTKDRF